MKCPKCNKSGKNVTFRHDYGKNGGSSKYCVNCRRKMGREYYHKNRKASLDKARRYRENNKGKLNRYNRIYYRENKDRWVEWKRNNAEKFKRININYRLRLKLQTIEAYGGRCSCCGESRHGFLTIEHINHDGKAHRERVGSKRVYSDLRRRGWPKEGFTLFCWNCQMATRYGDVCPHKEDKDVRLSGT